MNILLHSFLLLTGIACIVFSRRFGQLAADWQRKSVGITFDPRYFSLGYRVAGVASIVFAILSIFGVIKVK